MTKIFFIKLKNENFLLVKQKTLVCNTIHFLGESNSDDDEESPCK